MRTPYFYPEAALGWYHALKGTKPDEGIIVLAQVNKGGTLQGVDGVAAKAEAIAKNRRFDTVVVATEENRHQAKESLAKISNSKHLFVEAGNHQTINQFMKVRSQVVKELLSYLQTMKEDLGRNPLLERFGHSLDHLRVPLQVMPYVPVRSIDEIRAREHFRKTSPDREKEEEPERQIYAYRGSEFFQDKELPSRRERLDDLESTLEMAVLLGDPGSGKTEWLKYQARLAAQKAHEQTEGFMIKLQNLCFPVYLRLQDIAEALQDKKALQDFFAELGGGGKTFCDAERLSAAMLMSLIAHHRLPWMLVPQAWEKLNFQSGMNIPLVIYLDAWDEVRKGQEDLALCLRAFAKERRARIFLTSRLIGYNHSLLPFDNKGDGPYRELEICPFEWKETEEFVGHFFSDNHDLGQKMLSELRGKSTICGMAQNPLLATLLCMAYAPNPAHPPLAFPIRRCELYQRIIKGLLGEWEKTKHLDLSNLELIQAKITLIEKIASYFFPDQIISHQQLYTFLWDEKTGYMNTLAECNPLRRMIMKDLDLELIKELCDDALLVPCGGEEEYTFLHLTFQEYFTASDLARRANRNGWQEIVHLVDKKSWDPVWHEVIVLMAGRLEDSEPLLVLLSNKAADDVFRHRLALAALCMPEISTKSQNLQTKIMSRITTEYFFLWLKYRYRNKSTFNFIPFHTKVLTALGQVNTRICIADIDYGLHHNVVSRAADRLSVNEEGRLTLLDCLSELLRDKDWNVRYVAVLAVKEIGNTAAQPAILEGLSELFQDKDWHIRLAAAKAVGGMGIGVAQADIIEGLNKLLWDKHWDVRETAAWAIGEIGGEVILDRLIELLRDNYYRVRWAAIEAFAKIGSGAAQPAILERLSEMLKDEDSLIRVGATRAVEGIGSGAAQPAIFGRLFELLKDEDSDVRWSAKDAFMKIGIGAAQPAILDRFFKLLKDENSNVRDSAAMIVGKIGNGAVQPAILKRLTELLKDKDMGVRRSAMIVCNWIGRGAAQPTILERLTELLQDEDMVVRERAARAVGRIGSAAQPAILSRLTELFKDEYWNVQLAAMEAVGEIGSEAAQPTILNCLTELLVRQAQLGASCRVQVPAW